MPKKIKYLLFDMDGLLTDSERVTFGMWKKIFAGYGYELTLDIGLRLFGVVVFVNGNVGVVVHRLGGFATPIIAHCQGHCDFFGNSLSLFPI